MVDIGQNALLRGQFEKAHWALDASFYLQTSNSRAQGAPFLWQRGLSCFYTGHYQEGMNQFECDMSENGNDVEEVIWHFLCSCGAHGLERSLSSGFLTPHTDTTSPPVPPMQQVLELYRGTGSVEAVLASATPANGSMAKSYNDTNALAYAHFYVGLYYELRKEFSKARHYLEKAAGFNSPDYMGRLMGMHFELFCCRLPLKAPSDLLAVMNARSRLIQGGWQLSSGHLIKSEPNSHNVDLVKNLLRAVDAGIRSFDCGDIYTGVEELYGRLIKAHCLRGGRKDDIVIHTKLVPDLEAIQTHSVDRGYIESVVRRSLNRLGVRRLNLVQFHWWDNSIQGCIEALSILKDLVQEGLIERVGITNFDAVCTQSFVEAGIKITSTQVSSLLCKVFNSSS